MRTVVNLRLVPLTLLSVLSLLMASCRLAPPEPTAPAPPIKTTLAAGTEIPLVLLREMISGDEPEGAQVPLVVREDVKDQEGHVVIRRGTPAQGEVTWSRKEEMLGGLMNRPARLKFRLVATTGVDGQSIELSADPDKPDEPYELNRANTGKTESTQHLEVLMNDEKDRAVLEAVHEVAIGKGDDVIGLLESSDAKERLARIGRELDLPSLAGLAEQGQVGRIQPALEQMKSGRAGELTKLAANMPLVDTVLAMTGIAQALEQRLDALSHGRNIRAYVGTPIKAFAAKTIELRVPSEPGG